MTRSKGWLDQNWSEDVSHIVEKSGNDREIQWERCTKTVS